MRRYKQRSQSGGSTSTTTPNIKQLRMRENRETWFHQTIKTFLRVHSYYNGPEQRQISRINGVSHLIHIIITMMLGTFPWFRENIVTGLFSFLGCDHFAAIISFNWSFSSVEIKIILSVTARPTRDRLYGLPKGYATQHHIIITITQNLDRSYVLGARSTNVLYVFPPPPLRGRVYISIWPTSMMNPQ